MKRPLAGVVMGLALIATLFSSAACTSPCAKLKPPTEIEKAWALDGAEIERKVGNVECDLGPDGRWRRDE